MQVPQARVRFDPQFAGQDRAQAGIGPQRVGLAAAAVQGEHPLEPEPFPQGMGRGERLKLRGEFAGPAAFQQRFGPRFQRRQPQFLQPPGFGSRGRRVDAREGGAAPQARRRVEAPQRHGRVSGCQRVVSLGDEVLEAAGVEFGGRHLGYVAWRPGREAVRIAGGPQQLAEPGQAHLQAGRGLVRRLPGPRLIDQLVGCRDAIGVHEQRRQDGPGARTVHPQRPSARGHLNRTKDAELHRKYTVSHGSAAGKQDQRRCPP